MRGSLLQWWKSEQTVKKRITVHKRKTLKMLVEYKIRAQALHRRIVGLQQALGHPEVAVDELQPNIVNKKIK
jgi:hypothetical protein